ncbi:MAG: hypothetical protein IKP95_13430 [Ruminococcus sp.]|nr:hypothetical protein [Ruminococcus sp.]MBR6103423.1 hypothetical protein [Ruminococcus sp.]
MTEQDKAPERSSFKDKLKLIGRRILYIAVLNGIFDLLELLFEILFVRLLVRSRKKNTSRGSSCLRKGGK